jgi:two-component system, OmpR family, sensor histidine kinase RstB
MRSIFFRIYLGMLIAMLAILFLVTLGSYTLNKYRLNEHINQYYAGTFQLIGQGVARQQNEKRELWLSAIEKLSGLQFTERHFSEQLLSNNIKQQLSNKHFAVVLNTRLNKAHIYILLTPKLDYLEVQLDEFGSSLVRLSAFLILNELGRIPKEQRLAALEQLRQLFHYQLMLKPQADLHLPLSSSRAINKGTIAVILKNSPSNQPSLSAYAPLGNSPYVLILGPIPLFDWFPLPVFGLMLCFVLFAMAITAYLLVHPLEKRLRQVDLQIEQIGADKSLKMPDIHANDAIGKLALTVHNLNQKLHRMLASQNDMVRAISHELRAPITRIRFRLANVEQAKSAQFTHINNGIEQDLTELETLIDEVLTFSKLQREQPKLKSSSFNANAWLQQLVDKMKPEHDPMQITINCSAELILYGDKRYLSRAVDNLLRNASLYGKSQILISAQQQHEQFVVTVADDGIGIPSHARAELFEPFKRLDKSRNRQSGGYGLGLAIVQQVANWHKGEVTINDSIWGGAEFILRWPVPDLPQINDKISL